MKAVPPNCFLSLFTAIKSGYELRSVSPSAAPKRFPGIFEPEMAKTRRSCPLRSTAVLRKMGHGLGQASTEKSCFSKERRPLLYDLAAPGLDDPQDIPQDTIWNLRVVVAQQTFPRLCDPHLCRVGRRCALCHMDMDRLQRVALIGPEVYPIRADFKNLRHVQSLPAAQIPGSDGPLIRSLPGIAQFPPV